MKRLNCASFTPELADSEFFGHEKGAFTGAVKERAGVLDDPKHDLIILEELGTIPKYIQAKLLVYIETGEIRRLGSDNNQPAKASVRIIGVTNARPDSTDFREDFLFRFHVVAIPGLHLRRHDIPELLKYFIPDFRWTNLDVLRLMCYNWPGNMRQLRRFTYLVQRYNDPISDWEPGTTVEWFDHRFTRRLSLMAQGPDTLGVPHMKGIRYFFNCLMRKGGLGEKIGIKVPEFSLSSKNATNSINPFTSEDLEEAWDKWCYTTSRSQA